MISGYSKRPNILRSKIMRAIRSGNNRSTERRLRAILIQAGIRGWVVRHKNIQGKPDFIFSSRKLAVFIDGCFWHGCLVCGRVPHSNRAYWGPKIQGNRLRDRHVTAGLRKEGWRVLRAWEHELKGDKSRRRFKRRLLTALDAGPRKN